MAIAEVIGANGPLAVEAIKRSVRETEGMSEVDGLARELEIGWPIFATEDADGGPEGLRREATGRTSIAGERRPRPRRRRLRGDRSTAARARPTADEPAGARGAGGSAHGGGPTLDEAAGDAAAER